MNDLIKRGIDLIRESEKILVFTGAGLSTESGIDMILRILIFTKSSLMKGPERNTGR